MKYESVIIFLCVFVGQIIVCLVKKFEQKKEITVREMKRDCVVENWSEASPVVLLNERDY